MVTSRLIAVLLVLSIRPQVAGCQWLTRPFIPVRAGTEVKPHPPQGPRAARDAWDGADWLIGTALALSGAGTGVLVASAATDDPSALFPSLTAGAVGGAMLGAYASHRRTSLLGSIVGAVLPGIIGFLQVEHIDGTVGEAPPAEYAVAISAAVLVPLAAVVGGYLVR